MRTITRNPNPPACLAQQPVGQDWYAFMQTPCHGLLDQSLRTEQHRICCYCESSIPGQDGHVEHMEPRSVNPAATYSYANLAASCDGGTVEHCGHFKDNRHKNPDYRYDAARFCVPHNPATARLFLYLPDGDIVPARGLSPQDQAKAEYMIGYLGLRCPRLKGRRHAHARILAKTLGVNPTPDLLAWAEAYYLQVDQNGELRPFYTLSRTVLGQ